MKHFDGDLFINKIIPQLQILYVQPIEGGREWKVFASFNIF